jgi:hypothetical protein
MQPVEYERGATGHRRTVLSLFLGVLCVSLAWACDSVPPPTSPSPPPPSPSSPTPSPPGTFARYHLSGRVTDQAGSPISGAFIEVDYGKGGRESSPPSHCSTNASFCVLVTRTNDRGDYAVDFEPGPWSGGGIGYAYSRHDGYETNIQWLPTGSTSAVQSFRLRPVRRISAGASTVVSVEPDSSLCSDLEDLWGVLDHRCEVVRIEATAGTLVVEARAAEGGGVVPMVFWATTGNYAGLITRPGPGTVSIPVQGGTYQIFVGIPDGTASQRFDVSTLLR